MEAPAIVRRAHGRGRVVFMAGSPDGNVARLGSEDHSRMLVEAVRWAAAREPMIRTDGSTTTRVVAGWHGHDLVVHLVTAALDLTVQHGSGRTLETSTRTPAHRDVHVHVSVPISAATLEPGGTELAIDRDGTGNTVLLGRLSDWETIRFSMA
jgi:hypothetical protein